MIFLYLCNEGVREKLFPAEGLQCEVSLCIKVVKDSETKPVRECELMAWQVDCHIIWVDAESDLQDKWKSQRKLLPRHPQAFPLHSVTVPPSTLQGERAQQHNLLFNSRTVILVSQEMPIPCSVQ